MINIRVYAVWYPNERLWRASAYAKPPNGSAVLLGQFSCRTKHTLDHYCRRLAMIGNVKVLATIGEEMVETEFSKGV